VQYVVSVYSKHREAYTRVQASNGEVVDDSHSAAQLGYMMLASGLYLKSAPHLIVIFYVYNESLLAVVIVK